MTLISSELIEHPKKRVLIKLIRLKFHIVKTLDYLLLVSKMYTESNNLQDYLKKVKS